MWKHLKEEVYQQNPQTVADNEHELCNACQSISTETLPCACANFALSVGEKTKLCIMYIFMYKSMRTIKF